ncbi:MAG TPA: ABC transporter ATP-binding protein [Candidatus Limnocylindrales bacterium]|nr:ABC transporter ATP-binding protein [Candidatus Limnocylindrales bacterium]
MTPGGSGEVIRVDGLVKDYGPIHAVRGIDLLVGTGEVVGFLGPNGAGKSTTIRCLLDLLRPTAGRIMLFGLDPARDGVATRRRLAYVPGELRLPDRLSGGGLVASLTAFRGPYDRRRLETLAERLALDLSRPTRQLSSGNRRKLALLLAFLWPTELLVLDEPTSGLDPLMQQEFLGLVREARAGGSSVFLSSHVLSEVQRVADRVVVLRDGLVVASGTVAELRGRATRRVDVTFGADVPVSEIEALPGLRDRRIDGRRVTGVVTGSLQPLIAVLARHPVDDLLVEEPDLEETFLELYEEPA